jgi:hypothetical protein
VLDIDAVDRIVDAVLNVSVIAHAVLPDLRADGQTHRIDAVRCGPSPLLDIALRYGPNSGRAGKFLQRDGCSDWGPRSEREFAT